jgi:hypothetical protein
MRAQGASILGPLVHHFVRTGERMHSRIALMAMVVVGVSANIAPLGAQARPDTSKAKRDSIAAADSIRLVRELERQQSQQPASSGQQQRGGQSGSTNPRLLPDFSAVGDIVGDLSPKGSTMSDPGKRADIREVELAVQAAVDPFFRGDVFLGISDAEGISIEQAFLTTTALPQQLEVRMGRYLMPVGKINLTHRHDLHTIEYPWVVQRFLSDDGLKGTGLWALRVFSPFGFYQELNVTAVDRFGERDDSLTALEPVNKKLSGLAYSARLRNYWDLSESTNFELSGTALTGVREQPVAPSVFTGTESANAVGARQTLVGADVTFRWRPLQQGLYKSFIGQAEFMRQINEKNPSLPGGVGISTGDYLGPQRNVNGGYVFLRYQTTQRTYLGTRYDYVQSYDASVNPDFHAASAYLEFFPSEFSKLVAGYERILRGGQGSGFAENTMDRILVQASFALGPHKPHPF